MEISKHNFQRSPQSFQKLLEVNFRRLPIVRVSCIYIPGEHRVH
jgi:hypothetical protein